MTKNLKEKLQHSTLISNEGFWQVYENSDTYIKELKSSAYNYGPLLEEIKNYGSKIPNLGKIIELYYLNQKLKAYEVKKSNGEPIQKVIEQSKEPLKDFAVVAKELNQTIKIAEEEKLVFSDLMTPGNVWYDQKSKQINILGLDSIQTPNHGDKQLSVAWANSNFLYYIIENPKYLNLENSQFELTNNFNILAFYELFLSSVFQYSLTNPKHSKELMLIQIIKRLSPADAQKMVEEQLKEILDNLGFEKGQNLYGRIMDLANPNCINSIDTEDFKNLDENYAIDRTSRKLIRK